MTKPREPTDLDLTMMRERLKLSEGKLYWRSGKGGVQEGSRAGCKSSNGYRLIWINKKIYKEHRIIYYLHYGIWPSGIQVDHINGDRDDNRPDNLRLVSNSQNGRSFSRPKGGTSRFRGVCWNKNRGKWIAQITHNRVHKGLGYFTSEEEAALAYNYAALNAGFNPESFNNVFGE